MENTTAAKISAAMESAGISKNELASRTGIAYTTLTRSLREGRDFKVAEIILIARALGVAPATLLPELAA